MNSYLLLTFCLLAFAAKVSEAFPVFPNSIGFFGSITEDIVTTDSIDGLQQNVTGEMPEAAVQQFAGVKRISEGVKINEVIEITTKEDFKVDANETATIEPVILVPEDKEITRKRSETGFCDFEKCVGAGCPIDCTITVDFNSTVASIIGNDFENTQSEFVTSVVAKKDIEFVSFTINENSSTTTANFTGGVESTSSINSFIIPEEASVKRLVEDVFNSTSFVNNSTTFGETTTEPEKEDDRIQKKQVVSPSISVDSIEGGVGVSQVDAIQDSAAVGDETTWILTTTTSPGQTMEMGDEEASVTTIGTGISSGEMTTSTTEPAFMPKHVYKLTKL